MIEIENGHVWLLSFGMMVLLMCAGAGVYHAIVRAVDEWANDRAAKRAALTPAAKGE